MRDGDGGDGGEAEWVLFMKCAENECVSYCRKCKRRKTTITYHFVESVVNSQILTSVALLV